MEGNPFRSALLGGFNRADVVEYIEKSAAAASERIAALESDVDRLTRENHALRDGLSAAEGARDRLSASLQDNFGQQDSLRAERDAAAAERDALRDEVECLRPQAEEFAAVKENLAALELAARRRADAYEAAARMRTNALLRGCREFLSALDNACENVTAELQKSAGTISQLPAAFQSLRRELDELENPDEPEG